MSSVARDEKELGDVVYLYWLSGIHISTMLQEYSGVKKNAEIGFSVLFFRQKGGVNGWRHLLYPDINYMVVCLLVYCMDKPNNHKRPKYSTDQVPFS